MFDCCRATLSLIESTSSCYICTFKLLWIEKTWRVRVSFVHTHALSHVFFFFPKTSPASCADISSFSHTISTGLAPTRAEELLTSQLWPLDMLTVDDLCWCRCYVKSGPLRPHSAGAHLDCTQAGKKHWETFFFFPMICQVLDVGFVEGSIGKHRKKEAFFVCLKNVFLGNIATDQLKHFM